MISVNSSLPINLTTSHVEQYPDFVKLLSSLTSHVTDSGMSFSVHKDVKQVSELGGIQNRLNHYGIFFGN